MQAKQLRIMTIGAHPDDCELTTGGTCLLYASLGHKVKYVYATNEMPAIRRFPDLNSQLFALVKQLPVAQSVDSNMRFWIIMTDTWRRISGTGTS